MKRHEFLGIILGVPAMFVNRARTCRGDVVPDDVADKITIMGNDGKEYQLKPSSLMLRKDSSRQRITTVISYNRAEYEPVIT